MGRVKGRDMYERISFLLQTAYTLLAQNPINVNLICYYGHMIKMVSRRTLTRLGPGVKRQICKKCHVILFPGITSSVRLRSKRAKHIVVTCQICGAIKRFLSKPDFVLWHDKFGIQAQ